VFVTVCMSVCSDAGTEAVRRGGSVITAERPLTPGSLLQTDV